MASTMPRRIMAAASPMALAPVAQAVTTAMFGPRRPNWIATCPAPVSGSIIGIRNGLTQRGPRVRSFSASSSSVPIPPTPVPMTTPIRSRLASLIARRESASACAAATTANCVKRSIRRASRRLSSASGSKPLTSAAMRVLYSLASKRVIGPTPERPSRSDCQVLSMSFPSGVTQPTPVTTTRMSDKLPPPRAREFESITPARSPGYERHALRFTSRDRSAMLECRRARATRARAMPM